MPFVWGMVKYCLELPYGSVRHFPAGTYHAQTKHWTGKIELELMRHAHSAWYTFGHLKKSEWTVDDTRYFDALRKTPAIPPTRRLDAVLAAVWGISSDWYFLIMEKLRFAKSN